jgi:serine/threonine-protein kinase RsbW
LLTLELPNQAEAVGAARKALTSLNGSMHLVSPARLRDAQLLASELIANAVRHADAPDSPVSVAVLATEDVLRIEVRDLGAGFDPAELEPPATDLGGGWGLHLVGILATRWGVERGDGTTVWFEVDRPQRTSPLPTQR